MKVIFLDIDGVMNCENWITSIPKQDVLRLRSINGYNVGSIFYPLSVLVLNEVIEETGAKIVISSCWRADFSYNVDNARDLFKLNGVKGDIIDFTPSINSIRGEEIQAWLDSHNDIESIVIIDDETYDIRELRKYTVKTSWRDGLRMRNKSKILKMLNKKYKTDKITQFKNRIISLFQ